MKSVIIYEDKDILVIHKPAGIATQTAKLGQADVVSELKNYLKRTGQNTYVAVVHRLDQPVEGLLVFAKTPGAAKKLSADLQSGRLKKYYQALVFLESVPDKEEGRLTDYLVKDGRTNLSRVVSKEDAQAKKAMLQWRLCGQYTEGEDRYALAEIELFTGRHHQIRVQMSHAGMPLLGDSKYGSARSGRLSQALGIRSTALLASRLCFTHPVSGKPLEYTLPIPAEWNIQIE